MVKDNLGSVDPDQYLSCQVDPCNLGLTYLKKYNINIEKVKIIYIYRKSDEKRNIYYYFIQGVTERDGNPTPDRKKKNLLLSKNSASFWEFQLKSDLYITSISFLKWDYVKL